MGDGSDYEWRAMPFDIKSGVFELLYVDLDSLKIYFILIDKYFVYFVT